MRHYYNPMAGPAMAVLLGAAMLGSGYGIDYSHRRYDRKRPVWTLDEEEQRSADRMLRKAKARCRDAHNAVAEIAKATGPARQHFGYCRHPSTKSKKHSDSLRKLLRKGKRR